MEKFKLKGLQSLSEIKPMFDKHVLETPSTKGKRIKFEEFRQVVEIGDISTAIAGYIPIESIRVIPINKI